MCAWSSLAAAQADLIFLDGFQWTPATCREAAAKRSSVGCEFWAADLDNALEVVGLQGSFACLFTPGVTNVSMTVCANAGVTQVAGLCDPPADTCPTGFTCQPVAVCVLNAQSSPFAIQVSNPQPVPVAVTVRAGNGGTFMQTVPAGQTAALMPEANGGIPDQSLNGTGTAPAPSGYKVTADFPIAAYQANGAGGAFFTGGSVAKSPCPNGKIDGRYVGAAGANRI